MFRESLDQIVDHGAQAPRHLEILGAVETYLAAREMHEVLPIRRAEKHTQLPGLIADLLGRRPPADVPAAHAAAGLAILGGKRVQRHTV